jgi:hypothetical protein
LSEPLSCDEIVGRALIERYVAGKLSAAEVEALESHYLTCSRCQTDLRLAAAIRAVLPEVQDTSPAATVSPIAEAKHRFGRRRRALATAAAIAAALAGVLLLRPSDTDSPGHRDVVPVTEIIPNVEIPIGEVAAVEQFRWAPVASADLYRLTLYDAAGDVVWHIDTRETHIAPPDTIRLEPGALYLWQVAARVDWDRWVNSELVRFTISEP